MQPWLLWQELQTQSRYPLPISNSAEGKQQPLLGSNAGRLSAIQETALGCKPAPRFKNCSGHHEPNTPRAGMLCASRKGIEQGSICLKAQGLGVGSTRLKGPHNSLRAASSCTPSNVSASNDQCRV